MSKASGTVLIVANGPRGSAAAERSRRIAEALPELETSVLVRSGASRRRDALRVAREAARIGPNLIYVMDLAVVGVVTSYLHPRSRVIVDTGDAPAAFMRLIRAPVRMQVAARALEEAALRRADQIIVRGPYHRDMLQSRGQAAVKVVPDGVDLNIIRPLDATALRARLGLAGSFIVGIQGHFTWHKGRGTGLGAELVSALALIPDPSVHAVLIGEGPGLERLRGMADDLNVSHRLHTLGRVPYEELGHYLSLFDVGLLLQTNDPSSWVRTTGKLPTYMAAGRFVISTRVGTASDVLPDEMLLDYVGEIDRSFPERLAHKLESVRNDPEREAKGLALRELATAFEYGAMANQAADIVRSAMGCVA